MNLRQAIRRPLTWVVAVPVAAVLIFVVGPFVYVNFIADEASEKLDFLEAPAASGATTAGAPGTSGGEVPALEGEWVVSTGSQAGYRVKEILSGQDTEAAGYTSDVTGSFEIEGNTIESAEFTVDMTTVTSGNDRRDNQYRGRVMDVDTYPTATFILTEPVELAAAPADGERVSMTVTGDFTIRGQTRPRTFELQALRQGATLQALGTIPVHFPDFGIPNPTFGIAKVGDDGLIDFRLVFAKA